jgi:hypothetical protein
MEGTAVSYVREEAQLAFVRPKLTDPLLAYRTAANGEVGVLTTAFPDEWISDSKGKKAITDWVMRLIPFSERDRYMINIKDQGRDMQLEITLASPPGAKKPQVKAFNCFVRLRTTGVEIPVRIIPSTAPVGPDFTGKITVPRAGSAQEAHLFIEETKGEGAMGRKQRIPIVIPPTLGKVSQSKQEDEAFGVNEVLLKELAVAGNGRYLDPPGRLELPVRQGAVNIKDPLWPFLFLGGLTFYVCAFVLQRLDP